MFTKPLTESSTTFQLEEKIVYPVTGLTTTLLKRFGFCQYQLLCIAATTVVPEHIAPHHTVVQVLAGQGILTFDRSKVQLKKNAIVFIPTCTPYAIEAISNLALLITLSQVEL